MANANNSGGMLDGTVEINETFIGGKGKNRRFNPQARVIIDEYYGYTQLKRHGYNHEFVTHKDTYVVGDIYTQNVENLWSILKRGIYGVYKVVSKKYLQAYIDEYA